MSQTQSIKILTTIISKKLSVNKIKKRSYHILPDPTLGNTRLVNQVIDFLKKKK